MQFRYEVSAGSTQADDHERARREGGVLWAKTKALLDRLDELEAAPVERMAVAREVATAEKKAVKEAREALVLQAITDMRPGLELEPERARVSKVLQRLINQKGLNYRYTELPPRKVVKAVLKAQGL